MKHIKPLLLVGIIISLCSCNGQNKVNQEDITYDEIGSLYLRPDNIVLPSKENSDVSYEYYDNGSIKMEKFIQNGRIAREITYFEDGYVCEDIFYDEDGLYFEHWDKYVLNNEDGTHFLAFRSRVNGEGNGYSMKRHYEVGNPDVLEYQEFRKHKPVFYELSKLIDGEWIVLEQAKEINGEMVITKDID